MRPQHASTTAKVIAAATILLASDPRTATQVSPGAAELCSRLLSGSHRDRWLASAAASSVLRPVWRGLESLTLPGIVSHYWHRKRWIEIRCRAAIAEGFEQIVILGAGFDTLGLRLSTEFSPTLTVIEADHPDTQAAKVRALTKAGAALPSSMRFVALDLSIGSISQLPLDRRAATFIAEGVLMYLQPAAVSRIFAQLRAAPVDKMLVLFSFMTRWPDGTTGFRPCSWWIERWLAAQGEPFSGALEPSAMREYLAGLGFDLTEMATPKQLATEPATLEGENLVMCEAG